MVLEEVVEQGAGGVLIKDCVEAGGEFVLHSLLKKLLAQASLSDRGFRVVFVALRAPFTHYAKIARKQGCNLVTCMEKGHLAFIDLFSDPATWQYACTTAQDSDRKNPLLLLYKRIKEAVSVSPEPNTTHILLDDTSLLEVMVLGSKCRVLDFFHYCQALHCGPNGKRCSVVMLLHEDIYNDDDESNEFLRDLEHSSNVIIQIQPLSTGLASDVHGQISVVYRDTFGSKQTNVKKQFKVGESSVDFFLPGQQQNPKP